MECMSSIEIRGLTVAIGPDACPYVGCEPHELIIGRELFPGSDCLKWSDRKPMLLAELASYSSVDVICLQVRPRDESDI